MVSAVARSDMQWMVGEMIAYWPLRARSFVAFFMKMARSSSASADMSNQDETCSVATLTLSSAVRYPCLSHQGSSGDRSRKLRQSQEGEPARSVMSIKGSVRRNVAKSTRGFGRAPLSSDAHTG